MTDRGDAVYELLRLVRPILLNSARVVDAEVRALGWTVGSRAVMEVLCREEPMTVPQVAARLSLARQNVQRHVDGLLRLGHVTASPNPAHRRSVLVEPTVAGRAAYEHLHERELADLAGLAPACSDRDLEAATKVLRALDRDIGTRAVDPPTRREEKGE